MPVYRPSELIQFLKDLGISAKKGLSQNFLIDGNICRKIVKEAGITEGDVVLEIGPGPGVVTEQMLEAGAKVIAVEKDRELAKSLERFQNPNLTVFCEDILKFPFEKHLTGTVKVVSNLPYHITTPIMNQLVTRHELFSRIVVMVQDEVARRFAANPGGREFGSLSLFLQYHCAVRYAFQVSRNCFFPKPKVESAVVVFDMHQPPSVSDEEKFFEFTRKGFSTRRKKLRNALDGLCDAVNVERALESLGMDPKARAEQLSLEDFIRLFEVLRTED